MSDFSPGISSSSASGGKALSQIIPGSSNLVDVSYLQNRSSVNIFPYSYGLSYSIDEKLSAISTLSGNSIEVRGNGNAITVYSPAHGLTSKEEIYIDSSSNPDVIPSGFYPITKTNNDTFTILYSGVVSTSLINYWVARKDVIPMAEEASLNSWELVTDIGASITVRFFYAPTLAEVGSNTWGEYPLGNRGMSIFSGKTAFGNFVSPIPLLQHSYLRFVVTLNSGLNTFVAVNFKGVKFV